MDESSYKAPQYVNFRLMSEDRSSDENDANGYFSASEMSYTEEVLNGDDEMYNTVSRTKKKSWKKKQHFTDFFFNR